MHAIYIYIYIMMDPTVAAQYKFREVGPHFDSAISSGLIPVYTSANRFSEYPYTLFRRWKSWDDK